MNRSTGLLFCAAIAALAASATATAQVVPKRPEIYTCDMGGKRITRDRYINECGNVEQRLLNGDGSFNRMVPPTLTVDERSERDMREQDQAARLKCMQVEARRDRSLMTRYRDEAAHRKARDAALDDNTKGMQISEKRIASLTQERRPLADEAEFYEGKTMPTKLRMQLETNQTLVEAQRSLMQNLTVDIGRINNNFDAELKHLRKLWTGAEPGFEAACNVTGGTTGTAATTGSTGSSPAPAAAPKP